MDKDRVLKGLKPSFIRSILIYKYLINKLAQRAAVIESKPVQSMVFALAHMGHIRSVEAFGCDAKLYGTFPRKVSTNSCERTLRVLIREDLVVDVGTEKGNDGGTRPIMYRYRLNKSHPELALILEGVAAEK